MSWMNALSLGRQHAQEDRAIADQQRLGKLSAAALTASPEGRNKVLGQVAALDPNSAFGMRETFQREDANAEEATRGRLVNMAKMLAAAPEPMRGGLYSQMLPGLRQMGLQAPDVWQPELMGVVQSLAGADQNAPRVQSTQVLENGEIAMFMSDGTVKKSGQTAQSPFTIRSYRDANGQEVFERIPTRSYGEGGVYGAEPQQPAPAQPVASVTPAMDAITAQATVLSQMGQPPEVVNEFIRRSAQARGVQIDGGEAVDGIGSPSAALPPETMPPQSEMDRRANATLDAQTYPTAPAPRGPGRGQTDAQRAQAEADAAALKIRQETLAKAEAETQAAAPQRARANAALTDTINAVEPVIEQAISQVSGWTAGVGSWLSILPGTEAKDLKRNIETLQARLSFDELARMRAASPTGGALGAVSERELTLLGATVRSLEQDQSPAQLLQNMQAIQYHYERWKMTVNGIDPDSPMGGQAGASEAAVVRTGTAADGRRVRMMSDGRILDESGQEVR